MADSDDKDQKQTSEEYQGTGRQSTILGLGEQLLAEADRLAREVRDDAEREAKAQAASIVSEAERHAEDIVSAAGEKAKRLESRAHAAVGKLSERVKAELESSVSSLDRLMVAGGEAETEETLPQGIGHTWVEEPTQHPKTPRLQGYDVRSEAARATNASNANGH